MDQTFGGVINPHTTTGTILAAAATGLPAASTTYGEWISDAMPHFSPTLSVSHAVAFFLPLSAQAYTDFLFEQVIQSK